MKDVGLKLAEKRKSLKLSYDEVSKITKLPVGTIKAIEAGDLDHFQDDLSYVRFYVRSYCKALNVPYENFKDDVLDSVEDYTTTLSLNLMKEREEIETNITQKVSPQKKTATSNEKGPILTKKDRISISQNAQQSSRFRKAKKIDFAFLSLIIVIVIVAAIIIYVAFSALLDNGKENLPIADDEASDVNKTPIPEAEDSTDTEDSTPNKDESNVKFEQNDASSYTISGIKANEAIKIEITFKNGGSFNLWKGNTSFPGAYGVYEANATYTYESTVIANEILTLNFWNYGGAEIKVNGTQLTYDEAAQSVQDGVTYFKLTTKGE